VRVVKETRRYWIPLAAAVVCFSATSLSLPPLVVYLLIVAGVGFTLDAGTTWIGRLGSSGGLHEYKQ
jgi:hypothetical protein